MIENDKNVVSILSEKALIEIAKAEQAKYEAAQKFLELTENAGKFLGDLFGPSKEAVAGLMSDQCKYWRAMNINRLSLKVEKIKRERGMCEDAVKHLPFREAYQVIEAVSLEDDDSVQELWAELLASATDPNREVKVKKVYIDILKSISAAEVAFLNILWESNKKKFFQSADDIKIFENEMVKLAEVSWRTFAKDDRATAIQNLIRLRCITFRPTAPYLGSLFATIDDMNLSSRSRGFALVNMKSFESLMNHYEELIFIAAGIKENNSSAPIQLHGVPPGIRVTKHGRLMSSKNTLNIPELNYILTAAGQDLLLACKKERTETNGRE